MPSTSVQAELQMPSMMTRSPRSRIWRIFGLVLLDQAAEIARDAIIGKRRARTPHKLRQHKQDERETPHTTRDPGQTWRFMPTSARRKFVRIHLVFR